MKASLCRYLILQTHNLEISGCLCADGNWEQIPESLEHIPTHTVILTLMP